MPGIRANTDRNDFIIEWAEERFLDLAGIKSPGLSAAPAIAEEAVRMLQKDGAELKPRAGLRYKTHKTAYERARAFPVERSH